MLRLLLLLVLLTERLAPSHCVPADRKEYRADSKKNVFIPFIPGPPTQPGNAPSPEISVPSSTVDGNLQIQILSRGGDDSCQVGVYTFEYGGSGRQPETVDVTVHDVLPQLVDLSLSHQGYNSLRIYGQCMGKNETTAKSAGVTVFYGMLSAEQNKSPGAPNLCGTPGSGCLGLQVEDRTVIVAASSAGRSDTSPPILGEYIYISLDSGLNWGSSLTDVKRVWSSVAINVFGTKIVAAAISGPTELDFHGDFIYISVDSGKSWKRVLDDTQRQWTSVSMSREGYRVAAVAKGGFNAIGDFIYISDDGGDSWRVEMTDVQRQWSCIAMSGDGSKMIAGALGGSQPVGDFLYVSFDGGRNWRTVMNNNKKLWTSVAISQDGSRFVACAREWVYISTNGYDWDPKQVGSESLVPCSIDISANGTYIIYSSGTSGNEGEYVAYVSNDGGMSWAEKKRASGKLIMGYAPVAVNIQGDTMAFAPQMILRENNMIYLSADAGKNWYIRSPGVTREYSALALTTISSTSAPNSPWGCDCNYLGNLEECSGLSRWNLYSGKYVQLLAGNLGNACLDIKVDNTITTVHAFACTEDKAWFVTPSGINFETENVTILGNLNYFDANERKTVGKLSVAPVQSVVKYQVLPLTLTTGIKEAYAYITQNDPPNAFNMIPQQSDVCSEGRPAEEQLSKAPPGYPNTALVWGYDSSYSSRMIDVRTDLTRQGGIASPENDPSMLVVCIAESGCPAGDGSQMQYKQAGIMLGVTDEAEIDHNLWDLIVYPKTVNPDISVPDFGGICDAQVLDSIQWNQSACPFELVYGVGSLSPSKELTQQHLLPSTGVMELPYNTVLEAWYTDSGGVGITKIRMTMNDGNQVQTADYGATGKKVTCNLDPSDKLTELIILPRLVGSIYDRGVAGFRWNTNLGQSCSVPPFWEKRDDIWNMGVKIPPESLASGIPIGLVASFASGSDIGQPQGTISRLGFIFYKKIANIISQPFFDTTTATRQANNSLSFDSAGRIVCDGSKITEDTPCQLSVAITHSTVTTVTHAYQATSTRSRQTSAKFASKVSTALESKFKAGVLVPIGGETTVKVGIEFSAEVSTTGTVTETGAVTNTTAVAVTDSQTTTCAFPVKVPPGEIWEVDVLLAHSQVKLEWSGPYSMILEGGANFTFPSSGQYGGALSSTCMFSVAKYA